MSVKRIRRVNRAAILIAGVALLVASCGSDDSPSTSAAAGTNPAQETTTPAGGGAVTTPEASAPTSPAPDETTAQAPEVGVTADSVTISFLGGFSGPVGELTKQVASGFDTWVADVNAAGGIFGRKVVVQMVDHMDTPEGGVAACKTVQSNGSFLAVVGVGGDWGIMDCLEKAGIPNFYNYAAQEVYKDWQISFSMLTHLDDSGRATATFIKNKLGDGAKKIGVICANTVASKYPCDAFQAEAEKRGLNIVDTETIQTSQAQFTAPLLKLQNAGAENIAVFGATLEMLGILRDGAALQYAPKYTMGTFALDFLTQASQGAMTGVTGLRNGVTQDAPTFKQYIEKADKYGTNVSPDKGSSFLVYGEGLVVGHALELAGQDLTKASLLAALETVVDYSNGVTPVLTYKGDHAGSHNAYPAICCNEDFTWKADGEPASEF